jgi:hypothetical protein
VRPADLILFLQTLIMIALHGSSLTPSGRRTIFPAVVIVTLLCGFFVFQYHEHISLKLNASLRRTKSKAIITLVQKNDETVTDWLVELLPDWEPVVYVTDRTSDQAPDDNASLIQPLNMHVNRGREASVYLTYIIHHYHDLPDYMVFIHGRRYQLHNGA